MCEKGDNDDKWDVTDVTCLTDVTRWAVTGARRSVNADTRLANDSSNVAQLRIWWLMRLSSASSTGVATSDALQYSTTHNTPYTSNITQHIHHISMVRGTTLKYGKVPLQPAHSVQDTIGFPMQRITIVPMHWTPRWTYCFKNFFMEKRNSLLRARREY